MVQSVQSVNTLSLCPPPSEDPQNDRAIFRKNLYNLALEKIPSIDQSTPITRAARFHPYLLIAQAQLEDKDETKARETFDQAFTTFDHHHPSSGACSRLALAWLQFNPHDVDRAIKIACQIPSFVGMIQYKFETLGKIASMCLEQDAVLQEIKELADKDPLYSIITRIDIAKAQFQNSLTTQAKDTLKEAEKILDDDLNRSPSEKSHSYRLIAAAYAHIYDIESATAIITNKLAEVRDISIASRIVAVAEAKAGNTVAAGEYFRNALADALRIERDDQKFSALKEIAIEQINLGYTTAVSPILTAAATYALNLTSPNQQCAALVATASLQHQIQDFENAQNTLLATFRKISWNDHENQQEYYLSLFKAQYQSDLVYNAEDTLAFDRIQKPEERAKAERHIIKVTAQNDIEKALSQIYEINQERDQYKARKSIAKMCVQKGDIEMAIRILDMLQQEGRNVSLNDRFTYRILKIIVLAQAQLNDIAGVDQSITALAALSEKAFGSLESFGSILAEIATALPKK